MRVALAIVSLFASGGLQRDFLAIADILRRRGHDVHLIAAQCENELQTSDNVQLLPVEHLTNHGRDASFARALHAETRGRFDVVVGFNKMENLDVLYCADRCVTLPTVPMWKRWLPRHRIRRSLEGACFATTSQTHILMLSADAAAEYQAAWKTQNARMTILPPSIARDRMRPNLCGTETRNRIRQSFGLTSSEEVWLFVAAYPQTKGLDRALNALVRRPGVRLLVAGFRGNDHDAHRWRRHAKSLGVESHVSFLGHREDIPELMAAADVLVHPARYDMTGGVILEAICSGLPVITTSACGFAEHVRLANAGIVLDEPFDAYCLYASLDIATNPEKLQAWSRSACEYAAANDFTNGLAKAADLIEGIACRRERR